MPSELKQKIQDTVFCDLFKIPENQLMLFNDIHPELPDVTVDSITYSTLTPVFINQEYNDFSMVVQDKFMVFVEAQSGWSWNILPRILIYAAQSYKEYIDEKGLYIYGTSPIPLPLPEIYVVFTGERKDVPETISFSEAFFGGVDTSIEVRANMIHDPDGKGIICEYIYFTKVLRAQKKLLGPTRQAIEETIRICQEKGKLTDYLETRKKEVVTIMEELFDYEKNMSRYVASEVDAAKAKARAEEKENTALFLLRNNMAIPFIVGATGLSEDQIKQIATRHGLMQ